MEYKHKGRNIKIFLALVFGTLFFSDHAWASVAQIDSTRPIGNGDVVLYTLTSNCPVKNRIKAKRGLIVPKTIISNNTYVYFHGNDNPTVDQLCDGTTPQTLLHQATTYNLCAISKQLGAPIIISETVTPGNIDGFNKEEIECLLEETQRTFDQIPFQPERSLPGSYIFAGHSGGSNFVRISLNHNIPAAGALVFDGCYGSPNWCTQIASKVGTTHIYYGKNTLTTPAKSQEAYQGAQEKIKLFEFTGTHYEVPSICFLDHKNNDKCQGRAVPKHSDVDAPQCQTDDDCASSGIVCRNNVCVEEIMTDAPAAGSAPSSPTQGTSSCREGQACVSLINPLKTTDIKVIIGNAIGVIMGIIGSITFVVFVYGGVLWLTSAGNSERIQKGLQAMLWAGIGIIVVFSSYAIITLILTTLQAAP